MCMYTILVTIEDTWCEYNVLLFAIFIQMIIINQIPFIWFWFWFKLINKLHGVLFDWQSNLEPFSKHNNSITGHIVHKMLFHSLQFRDLLKLKSANIFRKMELNAETHAPNIIKYSFFANRNSVPNHWMISTWISIFNHPVTFRSYLLDQLYYSKQWCQWIIIIITFLNTTKKQYQRKFRQTNAIETLLFCQFVEVCSIQFFSTEKVFFNQI